MSTTAQIHDVQDISIRVEAYPKEPHPFTTLTLKVRHEESDYETFPIRDIAAEFGLSLFMTADSAKVAELIGSMIEQLAKAHGEAIARAVKEQPVGRYGEAITPAEAQAFADEELVEQEVSDAS